MFTAEPTVRDGAQLDFATQFRRLRSGKWVGSEEVDVYMQDILRKRITEFWFWGQTFYGKLASIETTHEYNYEGVQRWTRLDLFPHGILYQYEQIFVPINIGSYHWSLAVIDIKNKQIRHYDSLKHTRYQGEDNVLENLRQWVIDEYETKHQVIEDKNNWTFLKSRDINPPQQTNGIDCGVFAMVYADYLAERRVLNFSQNDIEEWRLKIASSILQVVEYINWQSLYQM